MPPLSRQLALGLSQLPRGLRPMRAFNVIEPFDATHWLFDGLWGGLRVLAYVDKGRVRLFTGAGTDVTRALSPLARAIGEAAATDGLVLDGEVVARDRDDGLDLPALVRRLGPGRATEDPPLTFYAWDLLFHGYRSLLDVPLLRRKRLLSDAVRASPAVKVSAHQEADGVALFEAGALLGMQGVLARRMRSPYRPGARDPRWLVVRGRHVAELVVGGYTVEPSGRRPFRGLLLGAYDPLGFHDVCTVAGGFTPLDVSTLAARLPRLHADAAPFAAPPRVRSLCYWCRPELVVEVTYGELGPDRRPRFPVFASLRPDVAAGDCTMDAVGAFRPPANGMRSR